MSPIRARTWLLAYAATLVAVTFVHAPAALAAMFAIALVATGRQRWPILRRTLLAVLAFNLTVSAGTLAIGLWRGEVDWYYLALVNLRVLLMVYLGFWFVACVDVLAALTGWPTLRLVATLAIGQIRTLERLVGDFQLAFESRNVARPRLVARTRHAAAQGVALMDKSVASATESTLAMKSRGAFDA